jgi:trimeric autotransporter adhesin
LPLKVSVAKFNRYSRVRELCAFVPIFCMFFLAFTLATACNQKAVEQKVSALTPAETTPADGENKPPEPTPPPKPISILVTPNLTSVAVGTSVRVSAIAVYPYGIMKDITDYVTWSADNSTVGVFREYDPKNSLSTLTPGSVTVTGNYRDISGSVVLTVSTATVVKITPSPTTLSTTGLMIDSVYTYEPVAFKVLATLSDGRIQDLTDDVTLSVDDSKVLLSNTKGNLSLSAPVDTSIDIKFERLNVKLPIKATTVSAVPKFITVSPNPIVLAKGENTAVTASVTYTDNSVVDISTDVATSWTSSDNSKIAIVSEADAPTRVKALESGQFEITASYAGLEKKVAVVSSIANLVEIKVSPTTLQLPRGASATFTATGVYSDDTPAAPSRIDLTNSVSWSSNRTSIANFMGSTNTLKASNTNMGNVTVTASFKGKTGSVGIDVVDAKLSAIEISPTSGSMAAGKKAQFSAIGYYTDGRPAADLSNTVTWSAIPPGKFTVSGVGLVTGVAEGTAELEAKLSGISKKIPITVTKKIIESIELKTDVIETGDSPTSKTAPIGLERQMRIYATYSDLSKAYVEDQATWTFDILSPGYSFAGYVLDSEGNKGKIKGVAIGKTKITASIQGQSLSFDFVVTKKRLASLARTDLTTWVPEMIMGDTRQVDAVAAYSDGSTLTLAEIFAEPTLATTFTVEPSDGGSAHVAVASSGVNLGRVSTVREESGLIRFKIWETDNPGSVYEVTWPVGVSSKCINGGQRHNTRFCWYAADFGQSCTDRCTAVTANYHTATSYYAGSGSGPFEHSRCGALLQAALGGSSSIATSYRNMTGDMGYGCGRTAVDGISVNVRFTEPATDPDASSPDIRRICACDQ